MAALTRWLAAVAGLLPIPTYAQGVDAWQPLIFEASRRCDVPAAWISAVMNMESRGNTLVGGRPIVSRAGAMGLMQLMPPTWTAMRGALALGADPFDPHDNIVAGACYLRMMYDRFGYPGLFGAYNAGPGRYRDWLAGQRALPGETIGYIARMAPEGTTVSAVPRVISASARSASVPTTLSPSSSGLFAIAPRP